MHCRNLADTIHAELALGDNSLHTGALGVVAAGPSVRGEAVHVSTAQAQIHILVARSVLITSELPGFDRRLLQALPTLWSTVCHNDDGLSFVDELRATEMGHVVEHVVLALLTDYGIYARGLTEWNWFEHPEGTFTITLSDAIFDATSVELALVAALELLDPLFWPPLCTTDQLPMFAST